MRKIRHLVLSCAIAGIAAGCLHGWHEYKSLPPVFASTMTLRFHPGPADESQGDFIERQTRFLFGPEVQGKVDASHLPQGEERGQSLPEAIAGARFITHSRTHGDLVEIRMETSDRMAARDHFSELIAAYRDRAPADSVTVVDSSVEILPRREPEFTRNVLPRLLLVQGLAGLVISLFVGLLLRMLFLPGPGSGATHAI